MSTLEELLAGADEVETTRAQDQSMVESFYGIANSNESGATKNANIAALKAIEEITPNAARDRNVLNEVDSLLGIYEEEGKLPAFGMAADLLINPNDPEKRGFVSDVTQFLTERNGPANAARASRTYLIANNFAEAYASLKGGGQITEYESKTVANSLNKLGQAGISDEVAIQELQRLKVALETATQRQAYGIRTNPDGTKEFRLNPDGTETQVATSFNQQTGILEVHPIESGRNVTMIPDFLNDEQRQAMYEALPVGTEYALRKPDGEFITGIKGGK